MLLIDISFRFFLFWSLRNRRKCLKITSNFSGKLWQFFSMHKCVYIMKILIWGNHYFHNVFIKSWLVLVQCRYDAETRKLKHMKPLPLELLQFLDEEIDFLGPYPLYKNHFYTLEFIFSWKTSIFSNELFFYKIIFYVIVFLWPIMLKIEICLLQ